MGGQESKKVISKSGTTKADETSSSNCTKSRRRITEDYLIIWADGNISTNNVDCQNTLKKLHSIVNDVIIFTKSTECIKYLNDNKEYTIFIITSGTFGQQLVPEIHNTSKLDAIYIFCGNKQIHENWTRSWPKIKGVHTSIEPICEALQLAVTQCDQNNISMSIISVNNLSSNENLNQLEPTFMYTQIFKEILLDMKHEARELKDLTKFFKKNGYYGVEKQKELIKEFQNTYEPSKAIWWYTLECFTYRILNQALRTLDGDMIIRMGFFLSDVHRQIEKLHLEQMKRMQEKLFIVDRGQGLSKTDFTNLNNNKGGLFSFNNFLSTTKNQNIALEFAWKASESPDRVGIVFRMLIDRTIASTPFACIANQTIYDKEEEVLFSMHTVFRIGEVRKLKENYSSIYAVDLELTSDVDKQFRQLSERIRMETSGLTGWARLGQLLIKIGQFDKANELYTSLLEESSNDHDKSLYCNQLGIIKYQQGQYKEAVSFYKKSIDIKRKTLPEDHQDLSILYNNIGNVYKQMGDYIKALEFYNKGLKIKEKASPINYSSIAISYSNIGSVYEGMGDYAKALEFYEKDLEITIKTLPPNHPDLAVSYNNIGQVYNRINNNLKALEYYQKAHKIKEIALPPKHPELAISYNNIGVVYKKMGDYAKALTCYENSLKINENALPSNHPDLAVSYNNIGLVYEHLSKYSQALDLYKKAHKIWEKALPPNHPNLACSLNNIGMVYSNMGQYSKALEYLEKALAIRQKCLPATHPSIKETMDNINYVKKKI